MISVLRYTEELEKVGFTAEQAKKSVQLWMDLMDQNFATKADFKEHYFMTNADLKELENKIQSFKSEIKSEMKDLRSELKGEMNELRSEMKDLKVEYKNDLKDLEHRLTIKLGVMLAASMGIISALISFKH